MKRVSTVLRALAKIIETAPAENRLDAALPSRFICCNLLGSRAALRLPGFTDKERQKAADYLHFLGMGNGSFVFRYEPDLGTADHAERQLLRRHWLMAAAYFWDEGVRP